MAPNCRSRYILEVSESALLILLPGLRWLARVLAPKSVAYAHTAAVQEAGGSPSLEPRRFYLAGERGIAARADELAASGTSAEERARILYEMRNALRTQARGLMDGRHVAQWLDVNDPNRSWEQITERYRRRGLSGDDLWNAISEAASRSRPWVNQILGLEP
jgi:hypothetical protein